MYINNDESDGNVLRLLEALRELSPGEWVSARRVAKRMAGTEEYADLVTAYAQLPEAHGLVAVTANGAMLRLTEKGLLLITQQATWTQIGTRVDSQMEQIAQAVTDYASRLKRLWLEVSQVTTVARADKRYVHAVDAMLQDEIVATDTPVTLHRQDASMIRGRVVGQEPDGGRLYIAFDYQVTQADMPARLSIDRAFLLHNLASSLRQLKALPPLAEPLLSVSGRGFSVADVDSLAVADQLALLQPPWTKLLWGPPGAGKTYAIGRLILRLLQQNPEARILLVAPANIAVDGAVEKLLLHLEAGSLTHWIPERRIMRYGYPRKASVLEREELLGPEGQEQITEEIRLISARIRKAEKDRASEEVLSVMRAELLGAQESLRRVVTEHLGRCKVVATTTTMAYLNSSPISELEWDTVIIDEVTMVPPAVCVYLSSLAKERFLLGGDPRQLGPVYQLGGAAPGADFEWMGRDIFDRAGISQGNGAARTIVTQDARLARIISQRRCTEQIWRQVEHLYPKVVNLENEASNAALRNLPAAPGEGVVVLDTSKYADVAVCQQRNRSWLNEFTATLAVQIATHIISEAESRTVSIAIITPYRAQVRSLRQLLKQHASAEPTHREMIEAGTIHQFQGSEADVVIFDMVDGPGRGVLGALLRGDAGVRLVTVAVTRARGKCILIANRKWCRNTMIREENALLWDIVVGDNPTVHVLELPRI